MKAIITLLLASLLMISGGKVAMQGIKIGDSESVVKTLKLEIIAQEQNMTKFETKNGNDFSLTIEGGKVVFMENDWSQNPESRLPLVTDFLFGITSLKDIRKKFSTNGFVHENFKAFTSDTHLMMFNCFEIDSKNNEILVTVTKVSLKEEVNEASVASKLKLEALMLADGKYLDKLWGNEKVFDPHYTKIKL